MKKNNNKGFALVETLIVSMFVMTILGFIFSNFYPLIGEYEKRENYDDIDSKYAAYWMKTIFEDNIQNNKTVVTNEINNNDFYKFTCNDSFLNEESKELCENLIADFNIVNIYITTYKIDNFKSIIKNSDSYNSSFKDYINYLPNYKAISSSGSNYRIILEIKRTKDENNYNAYATMEVTIE